MENGALKLSMVVRNMIEYPSIGTNQEEGRMGKSNASHLHGTEHRLEQSQRQGARYNEVCHQ